MSAYMPLQYAEVSKHVLMCTLAVRFVEPNACSHIDLSAVFL